MRNPYRPLWQLRELHRKIYLGAPYSHRDPLVMRDRFERISRAAMVLIEAGFIVFSPISHSHPISAYASGKSGACLDMWLEQDVSFMAWADALLVYQLPGYEKSKGLDFEINWFTMAKKPVHYTAFLSKYDRAESEDTNA